MLILQVLEELKAICKSAHKVGVLMSAISGDEKQFTATVHSDSPQRQSIATDTSIYVNVNKAHFKRGSSHAPNLM